MSDDVLESDLSLDLGGDKSVCCNTVVRDVDAATKSLAESRWSMVVPPMLYRSKHTSLPQLQIDRLIGRTSRSSVQHQCQLTRELINRLGVSAELQGHRGCVNCIEFNNSGSLLVSGSDDYQLLLWDVHSRKKLRSYTTSHSGNIFSVKFLPTCGTGLLISGAGDKKVEVRDIETSRLLHCCTCHSNRVKRIATSPHLHHTFFSAAEDGTVLQYDLRAPHQCDRSPSNVVVDVRPLRIRGYPSEVKCAALSPRDPNLLAVGANDPYVRIYDRRMIKPSQIQTHRPSRGNDAEEGASLPAEDPPPLGCCQYYVPGHLQFGHRERTRRHFRSLATTYLSYSPSGQHLLANLGGENIYLFDTMNYVPPVRYIPSPHRKSSSNGRVDMPDTSEDDTECSEGAVGGRRSSSSQSPPRTPPSPPSPSPPASNFSPHVQGLKDSAMRHYHTLCYAAAILDYSEAIQSCTDSPILFRNRATVLLKRNWEGDIYSALRDCFRAHALDPYHPKMFHWMISCFMKLGRYEEAKECLEDFRHFHKELSRSHEYIQLYRQIKDGDFQNGPSTISNCNTCGSVNRGNGTFSNESTTHEPLTKILGYEEIWRDKAADYVSRYAGHCNTTTDIKEAVFLGQSGEFVAAGSDDGNLFVWETATGNLVRIMQADENIVNCVQCHPSASMIVTSGIEHAVKIWEPLGSSQVKNDANMATVTRLNQNRMNADPLEMLFMHMGDLSHVFGNNDLSDRLGARSRSMGVHFVARREEGEDGERNNGDRNDDDLDDDDDPVPQHAFEYLRIPRSDAGGGGGGGGGGGEGGAAGGGADVQCRTC